MPCSWGVESEEKYDADRMHAYWRKLRKAAEKAEKAEDEELMVDLDDENQKYREKIQTLQDSIKQLTGQIADQVRKLTKIGDASDKPQLVILDIPDQGGYYVSEDKVDAEGIAAFVAKFKAGGLERKQLG